MTPLHTGARALLTARRYVGALLCLGILSGCSDDDAVVDGTSPGVPSLLILEAPSGVDSIEAAPTAPVVVRVLDGNGGVIVGTIVAMTASNMGVADAPGLEGTGSASVTTDSRGEAAAFVRFGQAAGEGTLVVSVPTIGDSEEISFTVLPGAAHAIRLESSDTAIFVGDNVAVTASTIDRLGNELSPPPTLTLLSGPMVADGAGYRATAPGVATFMATSSQTSTSLTISIAPAGKLALLRGTEVSTVRFDGSDREVLGNWAPASVREPSIDWDLAGQQLVVGGSSGFVVYNVGTGTTSPGTWPAGAGSNIIWPRFTPDGNTVYYTAAAGGSWEIRSMGVDGSNPLIVIPSAAAPEEDLFPSWAPDGSRYVMTADRETNNRFLLRIVDAVSGAIQTLNVEGSTPVWSPKGDLIGYQELGAVGSVAPDGSNHREFNPGWVKGVTWSPDGEWLVGLRGGMVEIMNVATGEVLRFPNLGSGFRAVAWRPVN